jgi:LPS-assembly protein
MVYRLATLVVALAAAAPAFAQGGPAFAQGGPAFAQGGPTEEKGPTTIDAQRIEGVGELEMSARGSAEIKQDELTIFGDVLKYNREFGRIEADGGARWQNGVDRFFGPRLRYNTFDDTGTFEQPNFLMQREEPSRGSADSLEFLGKDRYRFKNVKYTTCEPGQEDWRLEASELELDFESEQGSAKNPRLKFFDTTVLAAPFAVFPLDHQRKSGVLAPYYGHNTQRGLEVGVPYYWNIAPERDATITPIYMTRRGTMLKNEFRYIDMGVGELKYEYLPGDKAFNGSRQGITWQHRQNILPGLTAVVDYNRVSDDRYFIDLSSRVQQVSTGNLQQDAYLQYSNTAFGLGYGLQARVQRFQTLQDPLAPITPPYARVPQLNFSTGKNDIGGLVDATLPAEYVRFSHSTLVQGSRTLLTPTFTAPLRAPGWFVAPKAGLRYASYGLDRAAPGQPTAPSVSIPWLSLDSGLVFDRQARWFGENLTQTLEPRLYYVYVPFRNQDRIPVFDTGLADFSFPQLFTENRFGGGDRLGDANHLTAAVTSRFLGGAGQEAFRATVGQRYYFNDERVGLTPESPLRTFHKSNYLASVGGRPYRNVTFDATTEYNQRDARAERYTISTRYAPEIAKVITASYRVQRETLKQIDVSGQWPVMPGWYAVGRYNYSLLDKRLVEGIAGLEYNAGCWVLRFTAQRIQAATQVSSTGFYIFLELRGVGELGTDEALQLLKRDVPGYSVTNPDDQKLVPPSMQRQLPFRQIF